MRATTSGITVAPSEISRFIFVGVASTLLYLVLTINLQRAAIGFAQASLVSYLTAGIFSFVGHRTFTFASRGFWLVEAARFVLLNLAGFIAASAIPLLLTNRLGLAPFYAIIVTCIVAPLLNYLVMRTLIFRSASRKNPAM